MTRDLSGPRTNSQRWILAVTLFILGGVTLLSGGCGGLTQPKTTVGNPAPAPVISSLNPTSGPLRTSVTISGANFGASQGTSTVTFNGTAAKPTSWSAGSIMAPVPAGATSGNVVVTVGGVASNGVSFTVPASAGPTISSVNPFIGLAGGLVTIVGTDFGLTQGTSAVTFNGTSATPTIWSDVSIVVAVPAGATTGNVVVNVGGAASNSLQFTVVTPPIKTPANTRQFVDSKGVQWIMAGDGAHRAISNISTADYLTYLNDRRSHGFNTIQLFASCTSGGSCNSKNGVVGASLDGQVPFTGGSGPSNYDFCMPNSAYWTEVDTFVNEANARGMLVLLLPLPWGNGWSGDFQNNTTTTSCLGYTGTKNFIIGAWLGARYKNANIIWNTGQDFNLGSPPSSSDLGMMADFMAGIASTDPNHFITTQLNYSNSFSNQEHGVNANYDRYNAADFVYSYDETYAEVLNAYNSSPVMPTFLGESDYEDGNNTGALSSPANAFITRMEMWYAMTSGGTGHIFSNENVEHFVSGWQNFLDTTATSEIQYMPKLFNQYPWWTFVPDQNHTLVTMGYGTSNGGNANLYQANYATTIWNQASSYSITYTPVSTTLRVDLGMFTKPVTAEWYDPTTGTSTAISGSPFTNAGSQNFTTPPGLHSDGSNANDWVLVLHP